MRASTPSVIGRIAGIFALSCFSIAPIAQAQSGAPGLRHGSSPATPSRARRPGIMTDGDTIWVGRTPSTFNATDNWWSIGAGYGPGFHRPAASGGMWDWETPASGDSLNGWWPVRLLYQETGSLNLPDDQRPWWALDYGNQANYVINQGAGQKRTFGVVGVWHVDAGNLAAGGANGVTWAPLAGGSSAWMGLRRHGDDQYVDPITSNPFNEDALQFNGVNSGSVSGNDKGFPGYGSQMDQMLYRDIDISGASPSSNLQICFKLRTRMSSGKNTAAATRTGWFDKDPLAVTAGNFISCTDAGNAAPIDSFMVYVGCPVADVEGAEWTGSDGNSQTVFDPARRWFGELVRANQPGGHRELFTTWGDRDLNVCSSILLSDIASWGDTVRIVFRVKTNREYDDEGTLYSSGGGGAAVVDDVTYQIGSGSVVSLGTFESPNAIDNSTSVSALDAWKSTGRPPGIQDHLEQLENLVYQDIHGPPGSPDRLCNMLGGVISAGNHDLGEAAGGPIGTAEQDLVTAIVSPTIRLCGPYDHAGGTNAHGLTASNIIATDDYYAAFDVYWGLFDPATSGNQYRIGVQSYPANDQNGRPGWGQIRMSVDQYLADQECLPRFEPLFASGLVRTSNPSGIPDSIRIVLSKIQECFAFGLTTECSSTAGLYWDNVSLAISNAAPGLQISIDARDTAPQTFRVDGGSCLDASLVQVVTVTEGAHTLQQCIGPGQCRIRPIVEFAVDNAGNVSYDAALEPLIEGAGTNTLTVHAYPLPPRGDDLAASLGLFRIVVEPEFWSLMDGYPGYGVVGGLHRLVSPVLYDPETRIGRSATHTDGSAPDVNGTPVGLAMTIVKDSDFTLVPPGFDGPNGTLEIHTELRDMNLSGSGVSVRAGVSAPDRPMSPGEIEATPSAVGGYPAESFFDVFVDVTLPFLGGADTVALHNTQPLVIENSGVQCFPPHVVYRHSHTGPVPVVFNNDDPIASRWLAGDLLGWLVLAGHGMDFDTLGAIASARARLGDHTLNDPLKEFEQIIATFPEMADLATLNADSRDIIHYADPGAFTQPAFQDSLESGLANVAALAEGGDLCGALALAIHLRKRADNLPDPPDWVSNSTVRQSFFARIEAFIAADIDSASNHGGCSPVGVPTPEAPSRVSIVDIHPNPSLGMTNIGYALPRSSRVAVAIYDLSGRKVRTLVDAEKPAGVHWAIWEGSTASGTRAPSGTYFVRLTAAGITQSKRLVILR